MLAVLVTGSYGGSGTFIVIVAALANLALYHSGSSVPSGCSARFEVSQLNLFRHPLGFR
jgi:hypothetical protein